MTDESEKEARHKLILAEERADRARRETDNSVARIAGSTLTAQLRSKEAANTHPLTSD